MAHLACFPPFLLLNHEFRPHRESLGLKRLERRTEKDYRANVRLLCKFVAVVLLALWPAATSHTLLEMCGLIHVVHHDHHHPGEDSHEHNADNHLFADGDYVFAPGAKVVLKPILHESWIIPAFAVSFLSRLDVRIDSPGPAPPDFEPHFLQQNWHFFFRTALPVRAPSFLS
jgi:hypothetical protein